MLANTVVNNAGVCKSLHFYVAVAMAFQWRWPTNYSTYFPPITPWQVSAAPLTQPHDKSVNGVPALLFSCMHPTLSHAGLCISIKRTNQHQLLQAAMYVCHYE